MNIISSPAMYLDSKDRRMLRKFRKENKGKIISKSESDSEDDHKSPDARVRTSISGMRKELGLDEDLKRIEDSQSNNMIGLV
mmetsp:Transcript_12426/g.30377  ORF Transcript_12426/g.30377 Transcript_12426/m.30377 type:complete len:82 (-) Transcript_12426:118-363(-)